MNYRSFLMTACCMCCCATSILTACSSDDPATTDATPDEPSSGNRTAVNILTRTEGETQDTQLNAGLFMVNYHEGQPNDMLAANNYINNQLLTWKSNAWQTTTPIYWYDDQTQADFYAYAPYQSTVNDARKMAFRVKTDQRSDEAFSQSDLLWGTVQGQAPTATDFNLTLSHILTLMTVNVTADTGFTDGELSADDVSVAIGGTHTAATVDLQTGTVDVVSDSNAENIACHSNGDLSYKAVLIPQSVPFSNFIQVNWKGNQYKLQRTFDLEPRRHYSLTVKLKKTKSGFDIGIEGWDILPEDFGGTIGG